MTAWGAQYLGDGSTRFRLWAPACETVTLERDGADPVPMTREGEEGWFSCTCPADPGTRYRYRIAHDCTVPDPASRAQAEDVHGWSLVVDPDGYAWRNQDWRGRPWREAVIYELHVGLLGGFAQLAERLETIASLGVTAIELMPIAAVSGQRNWGYDGVLPYAPTNAYGSPEVLKALIDKAHELGLMVLLDVVYNHFGPDGNYIARYAPAFFDEEKHTPWGGAVAVGREPVARYFIDNALMWLEEYRFDGLRFDAVHAIGDPAFLDRMAAEIRDRIGPDRHVHLILENEENDAARLTAGYDAQWNDDFHNVMHVLLTGETDSYYGHFAWRPAERLAKALTQGFIYQGEEPGPRDGPQRGSPSRHLPPTAFVNFLQNHDQVGNRAMGERLISLADPLALRAATALLLLSPAIPMLFMGEEDGSETPFLFFTDFHDELADAVREGRRKEFAKFSAFADEKARAAIPDPNAEATFLASRPAPGLDAAVWRRFYSELLALRAREVVPFIDRVRAISGGAVGERAVQACWCMADGSELTIFVNLGKHGVSWDAAPLMAPFLATGDPATGPGFRAWREKP